MTSSLNILQVEDSESDAAMIIRLLEKAGLSIHCDRVEDESQMKEALTQKSWDAVISDYQLPQFNAPQALAVLRQIDRDIPFIVVSGTIGEEIAVEMMRNGAQDYMMKNNLVRLAPGLLRAVSEMRNRLEKRRAEQSLQESEERCHRAIVDSPIPIMLHAEDGAVIELSQSWSEITGYSREELATTAAWAERAYGESHTMVQAEIERLYGLTQRIYEGDYTIHTKSGDTRIWEFSSAPQGRLPDGRRLVISMAMDVTDRRQAEQKLRSSLEEKTILVKEVHHRVKNNLQIVVSLLNLQASGIRNSEIQEMFRTTRNRIQSMALLHETLYRSGNLARLDVAGFVRQLTVHLLHSFGAAASRIQLQTNIDGVDLSLEQAVPCGLIINELVSNAFKYAFPEERTGTVAIGMSANETGRVTLTIEDNGAGLPPSLDLEKLDSLGLKLVSILARQIGGSLEIRREKGALFRIQFQKA